MAVYFSSLNSGSNGNCYYVGNKTESVLIDAGLSCRETVHRMKKLGLDIHSVKAIFISHEHTDHIRGLKGLAEKYHIPFYISTQTWKRSALSMPSSSRFHFASNDIIELGALTIVPFPKIHDAAEPFSFVVQSNGINIGVFTDIGRPCEQLTHHFKQCHAAFLESNYDEAMLEEGHYPRHLKNRIRGGEGHLSNKEALDFFLQHRTPQLQHLILSHLSKENNRPHLVQSLFEQHAGSVRITVASRDAATELFQIEAGGNQLNWKPFAPKLQPQQLQLF